MKRVSGKQFCRALERKGWFLDRVRGSHHTYKKTGLAGSVTVPVHGNRTLAPGTQRQLMHASGLTDDDL